MGLSKFLFIGFAAFVLADPIPQAAATTTDDMSSFPTDGGSSPSDFASLSSLLALESTIPTLAPFAASALESAVPTSFNTGDACQTTIPGWYKSLPADVKSAISSYDIAIASWYSVHSSALNFDLSMTATLPGNVCAGTVFNSEATAAPSASTEKSTAASGATAKTTAATSTGSGATATGAQSSSTSKAAAPHATGVIGVSLAGVVGVLGLMAAL